jgi:peptidoglycan hydrolase-like protein with peptidoglycan-binding domain
VTAVDEDPQLERPVADNDGAVDQPAVEVASQRRIGRRALLVAVAALGLGAVGVATLVGNQQSGADEAAPDPGIAISTVAVERGPLTGSVRVPGSLVYADPGVLLAGADGIVTMLPPVGSVVERGGMLTVVGGVTTSLMYGALPAWRSFEQGMSDGFDVLQLEQNLKELGHFQGEPDARFTAETRRSVEAWQQQSWQEKTGTIPLGVVSFAPGPRRVSELKVAVGSSVTSTTPALGVTAPQQHVTADVALGDQTLVSVGAPVSVELPDGTVTDGKVADVGTPQQRDGANGGTTTIIPIVVELVDPAVVGSLQQANVSVLIEKTMAQDVLHVPVGALVALDERHFAVQVQRPDGEIVTTPVTTGSFAAGNVEISGDEIDEGVKVVVPS